MKKTILATVLGAMTLAPALLPGTLMAQSNADLMRKMEEMQRKIDSYDQKLQKQAVRINEQDKEIHDLRTTQQEHYLSGRRADEVRAMITSVLEDSSTRAAGVNKALARQTAGWSETKGFFIQGFVHQNFLLRVGGLIQSRLVVNYSDSPSAANNDDFQYGFDVPRARIRLSGHVIDPTIMYHVEVELGAYSENNEHEVWIRKGFNSVNVWVQAGQFKNPFLREFLIDDGNQQFVDRSLISSAYGGGYTQGFMVGWTFEQFTLYSALTNGFGSDNEWNVPGVQWASTNRLEFMPIGQIIQSIDPFAQGMDILGDSVSPASDFQSWLGTEMAIILGVATLVQQGDRVSTDTDNYTFRWTVDAALEMNGLSLFAAAVGNHVSGGSQDVDEWGFLIQGGFFVLEELEFVARFEYMNTNRNGTRNLKILTVGFNYYFARNRFKVSGDISYSFSPVSTFYSDELTGWRDSGDDENGDQLLVRVQVQLMF